MSKTLRAEKFASYPQDLTEEVQEQFEKVFSFDRPSRNAWPLPPLSRVFTDIRMDSVPPVWADLLVLKEELNDLKSHLNDKEITTWRKHTQQQHLGGDVVQHLKGTVNPDLCTQAWTKLHEILFQFDIVPTDAKVFSSIHMCEAPGAFISSVNHYIKTHRKNLQWYWWATTLNPYYEGNDLDIMIADDRILSLTLPNWYLGVDDTGNCMELENMFGLGSFVGREVDFVTADGSINCQDKPDEQESLVVDLHYCEIVTALNMLAPGGKFVLKIFTFFEHASVCMIYLLNAVFNEVHVFKPATSKPGNSELYLVCLGYIGRSLIKDYLNILHKNFSESVFQSRNLFFVEDIPKSFMDELQDCAYMFTTLQSETIRRNISLFENQGSDDVRRAHQGRELCTFMWTDKMDVKYIRDSCRLHPALKFKPQGFSPYAFTMRQHGNFYERLEQSGLPWRQRVEIEHPEMYLKRVLPKTIRTSAEWLQDGRASNFISDYKNWRPVLGKQLNEIKNSKYCLPQLLKEVNEALLHCQFLKHPELVQQFKKEFLVDSKGQQFNDVMSLFQKDLVPKLQGFKNCRMLLLRGKLIFQTIRSAFRKDAAFTMHILDHSNNMTNVKEVPDDKKPPPIKPNESGGGDNCKVGSSASCGTFNDDFNLAQLAEPSAKSQAISVVDALGVDVVMMDISSDVFTVGNFAEIYTKSEFLTAVILALKSLQIGGVFLLGIDEMLTRFEVCVFYILVRLFKKVSIVQVSHSVTCSGRLLVAYHFNGISEGLVKYLCVIGENLFRRRSLPKKDVLQFVDHVLITDSMITVYLNAKNNVHLYRLLSSMIEFEKTQYPLKICNEKVLATAPPVTMKNVGRRMFTSKAAGSSSKNFNEK